MPCLTPFLVNLKLENRKVPVPCGKCPDCLKRRISGWSFRLMTEEKRSLSSHFITLTYSPQHVALTRGGYMTLSKRDVQLFLKRLRKRNTGTQIKYYACGEYGGKYSRPHYHILLFNADINTISPSWEKGSVHFGSVSGASIGYTLKYMSKPSRIPMHVKDDRIKEFSLMSKNLVKTILPRPYYVGTKRILLDDRLLQLKEAKKLLSLAITKTNYTTKASVKSSLSLANKLQNHYRFNMKNIWPKPTEKILHSSR